MESIPPANTFVNCLAQLASLYDKGFDCDKFKANYTDLPSMPDQDMSASMAKSAGLQIESATVSWGQLSSPKCHYPLLAQLNNGNTIIVSGYKAEGDDGLLLVSDPLTGSMKPFSLNRQRMGKKWDGQVYFVKPIMRHSLLRCFTIKARNDGVDLSLSGLIHQYSIGEDDPVIGRFMRIATEHDFKAQAKTISFEDLSKIGNVYPFLVKLNDNKWVILASLNNEGPSPSVDVVDPLAVTLRRETWAKERFLALWRGDAVFLKRNYKLSDEKQPFGLRWFIPELLKHKTTITDVTIAAVAVQLIGLVTPLYLQIIIDKVMVHQSFTTLNMLGAGMIVAFLFEAAFSYLRGYLLLYGTSKIDIRVATRTFQRLLSLPIFFFDKAPAGVLIKHMQQADKIRSFLTGKLFSTLLDTIGLFVFLPVLYFYSWRLSTLVLLFSLLIAVVIALIIPPFRRRLAQLYNAEGERQSFLVESIHGMETIKSLALEPLRHKNWEEKAARAIGMNFDVGKISTLASSISGIIEKLMTLSIIWWGVFQVFDNQMTVGALIAFQMLSRRVSTPLVQIVSLVHEYQEVALSVKMLGAIMNETPERSASFRGITTLIRGDINFENVNFSYGTKNQYVLRNVTLRFPAGKIVGIVGRSGSGKSTLARLIQGLYLCQEGIVKIDGIDLREFDLALLRKSIGMVLQENFLFHATIRENIAATRTGATFEQIVQASRYAGAEEFIEKLPQGYNTILEENGNNLSGGQKQRLAIARVLLADPRILIFDEATSALDSESEAIIQNNLRIIAQGRTMIIISHRLSMLMYADTINVMDEGRVIADGPHKALVESCEQYRALWFTQNRHLSRS